MIRAIASGYIQTSPPNDFAVDTVRVIALRRAGWLGLVALGFSLLAGCATHSPPKVDEASIKQYSGRGYLTDDRYGITTTLSTITTGEYSFDVAWTVPATGKELPVVIYLPGLGESRASGGNWRSAWAQAGYAVLSVQLLGGDEKLWSSAAARRGDFALLARERFAKDATTARMKALAELLAE